MISARTLTLAILALLWTAAAALAAPAVVLAPKIGPPTTKTTVTGTGFAANKLVDVFFDTTDMCLAATDAAGAFTCTIKVPSSAQPQFHYITAMERVSGTAAQKPFVVRTDMAQYHGRNAQHTGLNPFENTITTSTAGNLDLLWSAAVGPNLSNNLSSAVVSGGVVYANGTGDAKIYAFNASTGTPIPGFPVTTAAGLMNKTPAVAYGRVFAAGFDGKLYAYSATTGAPAAGFPVTLGAVFLHAPSVALGNVYVGDSGGKVYAVNATTGVAVPGFPVTAGFYVEAAPSVYDGKLFVSSLDGNLYGFDALTGAALSGFPYTTAGSIHGSAALVAGMGFFGSIDNALHGVNLSTGASLFGFPVTTAADDIVSSPAVAGGRVHYGAKDNKLYAVSLTGAPAWTVTLDSPVIGAPMAANGVVFVNTQNQVYALSASGGTILWSSAPGSGSGAGYKAVTVANGIVYFVSAKDRLYAYSVHGEPVSARLPGGALGVKPSLSALKPDYSLKPSR